MARDPAVPVPVATGRKAPAAGSAWVLTALAVLVEERVRWRPMSIRTPRRHQAGPDHSQDVVTSMAVQRPGVSKGGSPGRCRPAAAPTHGHAGTLGQSHELKQHCTTSWDVIVDGRVAGMRRRKSAGRAQRRCQRRHGRVGVLAGVEGDTGLVGLERLKDGKLTVQ